MTVTFVLMLTACGAKDETKVPAPVATPEPVEEAGLEGSIIVSAAGSLTQVGEELKVAFIEKNPKVTIDFNFAASGALVQQIQNGAPSDLFLSAAAKDMNTLEDASLIVKETRTNFARNEVVVVAAKDSALEMKSLEDLATLEYEYYAQGDFEATPIGRYAKQAQEGVGIWEQLTDKRVLGTDVNQILAYVTAGNAQLGFVFKTDAIRTPDVKVIYTLDVATHDKVVYPGAVVTASTNQELAQAFLDFIVGEEGQAILASSGFASAN